MHARIGGNAARPIARIYNPKKIFFLDKFSNILPEINCSSVLVSCSASLFKSIDFLTLIPFFGISWKWEKPPALKARVVVFSSTYLIKREFTLARQNRNEYSQLNGNNLNQALKSYIFRALLKKKKIQEPKNVGRATSSVELSTVDKLFLTQWPPGECTRKALLAIPIPTKPFPIVQPHSPSTEKFYALQKRRIIRLYNCEFLGWVVTDEYFM